VDGVLGGARVGQFGKTLGGLTGFASVCSASLVGVGTLQTLNSSLSALKTEASETISSIGNTVG